MSNLSETVNNWVKYLIEESTPFGCEFHDEIEATLNNALSEWITRNDGVLNEPLGEFYESNLEKVQDYLSELGDIFDPSEIGQIMQDNDEFSTYWDSDISAHYAEYSDDVEECAGELGLEFPGNSLSEIISAGVQLSRERIGLEFSNEWCENIQSAIDSESSLTDFIG